jgi:hypothetical protein
MTKFFDEIKLLVAKFEGEVKTEVATYVAPAISYIESNGGAVILTLAETTLAGFSGGESWATILAAFIPAAEKAGVTLSEGAASAVLNFAKANILAKQASA